ncbi:MAG: ATP-binding protein [Oligoflexia bacterium]|nr:ATP-binding protein [Oligoflexia bacterium]
METLPNHPTQQLPLPQKNKYCPHNEDECKDEGDDYHEDEGDFTDRVDKKIRPLPEHVVNQIKAGEVIERPANLLKELLENSLDAGASRISIHLVNNGLELISVVDDGDGISYEDLPWAFVRHATSKIRGHEDLFNLASYGFRGEALASMASISRIGCTSIPKDGGSGGKIVIEGGEIVEKLLLEGEKAGGREGGARGANGTAIFVRDLFYNTPVRLKFVRSKISERNALKRMIAAYVLCSPQVTFEVKWDNHEKEIYQGGQEEIQRISSFMGMRKEIIGPFVSEYEGHAVRGYVVFSLHQRQKGGQSDIEMIFVNRRIVTERNIHQRIIYGTEKLLNSLSSLNGLNGLNGLNSSGINCNNFSYLFFIDVPPENLDVNVHPSKTQIKFLYPSIIYSLVNNAIDNYLKERISGGCGVDDGGFVVDSEVGAAVDVSADVSAEEQSPAQERIQKIAPVITFLGESWSELGKFWVTLKDNNSLQVINRDILQLFYFWYSFKSNSSLSDSGLVPLLVSVPFPSDNAQKLLWALPLLRAKGFEFDIIDRQTLVLRSLPKYLVDFDYQWILKVFLHVVQSCYPKDEFFFEEALDFDLLLMSVRKCEEEGKGSKGSSVVMQAHMIVALELLIKELGVGLKDRNLDDRNNVLVQHRILTLVSV